MIDPANDLFFVESSVPYTIPIVDRYPHDIEKTVNKLNMNQSDPNILSLTFKIVSMYKTTKIILLQHAPRRQPLGMSAAIRGIPAQYLPIVSRSE